MSIGETIRHVNEVQCTVIHEQVFEETVNTENFPTPIGLLALSRRQKSQITESNLGDVSSTASD